MTGWPSPMPDRLASAPDVQRQLGVTDRWIREHRDRPGFPAAHYDPTAVRAYLEGLAVNQHGEGWTRERIVEAMLRWYERYGEWPWAGAWNAQASDYCLTHAKEPEAWPSYRTVARRFGSWDNALAAAQREHVRAP